MDRKDLIWHDRKRHFGLPISFTAYSMSNDRIFIKTGCFNIEQNEVRLYRVLDLKLKRNLIQRLFGVGTVIVSSSDKNMGTFSLVNIAKSDKIMELISDKVEEQRDSKHIVGREYMSNDSEYDIDDNDTDDNLEE